MVLVAGAGGRRDEFGVEVGRGCRAHAAEDADDLGGGSGVHRSAGLVTALAPHIGYAAGTALARRALAIGRPVRDLAAEAGLLSADRLDTLLSPENLTGHTARPSTAVTE
ncbi:hypothetical protein [Streptomyces massasporeus]|uniref:hypothetical protein n=1 Tax=Streptomyces massasporeus TaxID=67324 RepID=UPI0036BD1E25